MPHIDINKFIRRDEAVDREMDGYLLDLPEWDEQEAERLAREEEITLTPDHWTVVKFVREHYIHNGRARSGRVLSAVLDEEFAHRGGRRWLYQLFPRGPVAQSSRIAGLPLPPYTIDRSFGSVE